MASYKRNRRLLTQMLSTEEEMKPLPLQMRSKTASEIRLLAEIISRRRRSSNSSITSSRSSRGLSLWESITKEWNSIQWVSKRTPLQLRKFWGNHKCRDPVVNGNNKSGKSSRKSKSSVSSAIEVKNDVDSSEMNIIDSDNDNSHDIKLIPEIEIITDPGSVMAVSRNGQLNFFSQHQQQQLQQELDSSPSPLPFDDDANVSSGGMDERLKYQHEEHELRMTMLRQQQLYKQVEHAAIIEQHDAAMKVYQMQMEYWKKMISKL
ncbi:hypothetical protein CHUAL_011463 [Chamberlinius hualienensis]